MTANPNEANLRELRTLNDLDLGALATVVGPTSGNVSSTTLVLLTRRIPAEPELAVIVREVVVNDPGDYYTASARRVAALGAKVRAALPAEPNPLQNALDRMQRALDCEKQSRADVGNVLYQIREGLGWKAGDEGLSVVVRKTREQVDNARQALADLRGDQVSTAPLADQIRALPRPAAPTKPEPRVLQSADEAPRGSLWARLSDGWLVMRQSDGWGCNVPKVNEQDAKRWPWNAANNIDRDFPAGLLAEGLTKGECRHLSGLSAADALAWAEQRAKKAAFAQALDKASATFARGGASKPRPQPGDTVPWAEVEDGALYSVENRFRMALRGTTGYIHGPKDSHIESMLRGDYGGTPGATLAEYSHYPATTLVARDLGTDPEAWRRAMREWTANGNRPPKAGTSAGYTLYAVGAEPTLPAPAADPLAPLRAAGVLGRGPCDKATPERVVALALERIEADRREIERLRAANVEARRALETPGRQGLRARLVKAEAAIVVSDLRVKALENDRAALSVLKTEARADANGYRSDRDSLRAQLNALIAQRDEARRALADEKIKTSGLDRDIVHMRRLLDGRFFPAELIEPLRALVPASAVNAEQVVAAVVDRLQEQEATRLDAHRYRNARVSLGVPAGGSLVGRMGELEDARRVAEAKCKEADARADKAERNLRAAADLLAA